MKPARTIELIKDLKEAGHKVSQHVQLPLEVEKMIDDNTIEHKFENGDVVKGIVINGKFYSAKYYVSAQKEWFDLEEEANFLQLREDYNF